MDIILGALLGLLAGTGVWPLAQYFIVRTPPNVAAAPSGQVRWIGCVEGTISPITAMTIAVMAALGGIMGWRPRDTRHLLMGLLTTLLLAAISVVDFRVRRIPNALCLALVLLGLVQALWLGQPTLWSAFLGVLVGGGLFLLVALAKRGAMGAGDVKLAAALGAVLGYPLVIQGLLWGVLAGGAAALLLLAAGRVGRRDTMAYGPYIALGGWVVWMGSLGLWS